MLLPAVILICIVAYSIYQFIGPDIAETDSFVLLSSWGDIKMPVWLNHIFSLATYIVSVYLLVELNNRSDILRVRKTVLIAAYFLFATFCPELYTFTLTKLSVVAMLFSLFFLFNSYQCRNSSNYLFHSFSILSIGSIFFPQLMYCIPIWFIGSFMLQSLNLRSFFAAMIGFSLPYWFLLSYAFYVDNINIFFAPFIEITQFGGINIFSTVSLYNILSIALFLIIYIISFSHCLATDYDNKIQTRVILHFIIFLNICLFIFAIIQPIYEVQLLNLILPGFAFMTCYFFSRSKSNITYYIFIAMLILLSATFVLKIIPLTTLTDLF